MAADHFDETDPSSVLAHARKIKGLTIAELSDRLGRPDLAERTGKGRIGHIVEMWFGVEYDNASEPDLRTTVFKGSDYRGLEIKVVPIERKPRAGDTVKERNVVTMISYHSLPEETWPVAKLRKKMEHMLFVYYLYEGGNDWMQSRILDVHLWSFGELPEPERSTIHDDWTVIRDKVARGGAHDLHEGDTRILKANRKGAGGAEAQRDYSAGAEPAYGRSFSISRGHMDLIWKRDVKNKTLHEVLESEGDFESQVLAKLRPLEDLRLRDINPDGKWEAKDAASRVIRRALGFSPDEIKEFIENETIARVVPIYSDNGTPKEAVSFPTMNLCDFAEEDWDEATIREYLSCILFVPVLLPTRGTKTPDSVVGRAFFWRPTSEEELGIQHEWKAYQDQVKRGDCRTIRVDSRGYEHSALMGSRQTKFIHMRPHGKNKKDQDVDPLGNRISKQSFWLNAKFVKRLYSEASESWDDELAT